MRQRDPAVVAADEARRCHLVLIVPSEDARGEQQPAGAGTNHGDAPLAMRVHAAVLQAPWPDAFTAAPEHENTDLRSPDGTAVEEGGALDDAARPSSPYPSSSEGGVRLGGEPHSLARNHQLPFPSVPALLNNDFQRRTGRDGALHRREVGGHAHHERALDRAVGLYGPTARPAPRSHRAGSAAPAPAAPVLCHGRGPEGRR